MTAKRVGVFIDGGYTDHMNRYGFAGTADYPGLIEEGHHKTINGYKPETNIIYYRMEF